MDESKAFNERNYIFLVKAFGLFSIVSAHVAPVGVNTFLPNMIFGNILNSIGTIGVGVFFLLSGYLYFQTTKTFLLFFLSKIKRIIVPWFFCGTLLFFYVAFRKGGINFLNWFVTLTVYSHMYYLTILMFFYLLFWYLKKSLRFLVFLSLLSIISITLAGQGIPDIYPYINPLNWALYFILGLVIKRNNLLEKLALFCKKWFLIISSAYVAILIIYLMNGLYISYWKYAAIIAELLAIAMIFGVASYCTNKKIVIWMTYLGKMSFSIYLLHTPLAGIVTNLFNRFELWYLTLFRPIIVIIMTVIGIEIIRISSKKFKINKMVDILLGVYKVNRSQT